MKDLQSINNCLVNTSLINAAVPQADKLSTPDKKSDDAVQKYAQKILKELQLMPNTSERDLIECAVCLGAGLDLPFVETLKPATQSMSWVIPSSVFDNIPLIRSKALPSIPSSAFDGITMSYKVK